MRFKSPILSQASGSIAGATYSHNAGGMYMRQRATPTDPNTALQSAVRAIVSSLVNLWSSTLTADQRAAWATYAENVPLNDVFGDPRFRSGLNHYVRSNVPRLQVGITRVDDGPTVFNLGEYTAPSITIAAATNEFDLTFTEADDWVTEDDSNMLIYASSPKAATINFFKGPYRFASRAAGSVGAPPASPITFNTLEPFTAGQKGFFRVNVSRADGRLGTPFLLGVLAA